MNRIEECILSLIKDFKNDPQFNLSISYKYDEEDDMYYIFHDVVDNDFNDDETFQVNTKLIRNLDEFGIINYTFGYSEHVELEELSNSLDYISKSFTITDKELNDIYWDIDETFYSKSINSLSDNNAYAA